MLCVFSHGGRGTFSHVYFPHLFFGIWFGCFVSFITHRPFPKRKPCPCMLESKRSVSLALSNTQTCTNAHIQQHGGCFSGALYGLRRWKHIIKVQRGLQGFTGRNFVSFVNLWLKGLHIKLEGLSSGLLLRMLPVSFAILAMSVFAYLCISSDMLSWWDNEFVDLKSCIFSSRSC